MQKYEKLSIPDRAVIVYHEYCHSCVPCHSGTAGMGRASRPTLICRWEAAPSFPGYSWESVLPSVSRGLMGWRVPADHTEREVGVLSAPLQVHFVWLSGCPSNQSCCSCVIPLQQKIQVDQSTGQKSPEC